MRQALKFLSGSVLVYLIMAACSSSGGGSHGRQASNDRGGGGTRPRGGAGGTSSGAGDSSGGTPGTAGEPNGGMAMGGGMGTAGEDDRDGGPGESGGPNDSGILDSMTDPVPDAMADSGSTSGSRLKARYYAGEDGSRQGGIPYGWYDSERQENCGFSLAADGAIRCLPQLSATAVGSYFANASCTQELAIMTAQCFMPTPKYVGRWVTSACGLTTVVHQAGAAYTSASYYVKSGTSCVSATVPTTSAFYLVGAEVSPSAFVRATEEVEP